MRLALRSWNPESFATYVNTPESSTMSSGHILVQPVDSFCPAHLSVLLVHVVGTGARIISDPDAEVLDLERSLLVDDVEGDNFTVGFLDLAELHQEIPESRLCDDGVGCKNAHAVELRSWVGVSWQMTANDLVFCKAT